MEYSQKKPNSLAKDSILRGRGVFELMNDKGLYHSFYPISIVYLKNEMSEIRSKARMAVWVSKKRLKRAVDRNLAKRRIKEAYRKNKRLIEHESYNIVFIYLHHDSLSFHEIEHSVKQALLFLNSQQS